ncbi:uncharacterized protein LOC103508398, partial [Gryllus bimaculatus]
MPSRSGAREVELEVMEAEMEAVQKEVTKDLHYLPGQHPGFGPVFPMFGAAPWLDPAYLAAYPWHEYLRRPDLCKLPAATCSVLK